MTGVIQEMEKSKDGYCKQLKYNEENCQNPIAKIPYSFEVLEKVLNGIPDIIGVYKPDHTIMFYNQAGYDFHKITPYEAKGKKCYEMLGRTEQCTNCPLDKAIYLKEIVRRKKYISKFGKYMDCFCNPVLDDSRKILFVVEQLRDISDRQELETILKESADNYKNIINLFPYSIVIRNLKDGRVVLANEEALKLYNPSMVRREMEEYNKLDLEAILTNMTPKNLEEKKFKRVFDYRHIKSDNSIIDMEITFSYINYKGKPAILSFAKHISERKRELNTAANYQKQVMQKPFPLPERAVLETLYLPAKIVSGDFYFFHRVTEDLLIGILGDVSGKGITAALSISAFNVLFHEAVLVCHNPSEIINILNQKLPDYLDEKYVAACCFSFDFNKNEVKVVGAGINEFMFQSVTGKYEQRVVKGPFLGMFEDSVFDEQLIKFHSGEKFYFFTDGLDLILLNKNPYSKLSINSILSEFVDNIDENIFNYTDEIEDDCTLLTLEIK